MLTRFVVLALCLAATSAVAKAPRLTLFISVDALSSDQLLRMRPRLKLGLGALTAAGAFYPNAQYGFAETVTSAGHATLATGANPWRHGIVSNRIVNRNTGRAEAVFADASHPPLEAPIRDEDVSPEALLAETLSDRLKLNTQGRGKAIAIAGKARAAVAMAGRLGQAYWFHEHVGKFITGTYYVKEFPAWLKSFNDRKLPDGYFGKDWPLLRPQREYLGEDNRPYEADFYGLGRAFPHPLTGGLPSVGPQFYSALASSPYGNDLLVQLARAVVQAEGLGKDDVPDVLSIGFSAIDRVYHLYGPFSWEAQDALLRLDRNIADVISLAEKAAGGRANLLVVLSADHGGAAIPEEWIAAGLPAARVNPVTLHEGLKKELAARFGASDLVSGIEEVDVYLNSRAMTDRKLDAAQVRRAAAAWLSKHPSVQLAVARDDLYAGDPGAGLLRPLRLGFHPDKSGDVLFVMKPFHVLTDDPHGTSHGTPYTYDTQVPIIFFGKGVKAGWHQREVSPTDVAPTLASLLEMGAPSLSEGTVLTEVVAPSK